MKDSSLSPSSRLGGAVISDRVVAALLQELRTGRYADADRLPAEVDLAAQLGVSRTVIRDALSEMERAGYIERVRGIGTVVNRTVLNLRALHSDDELAQGTGLVLERVKINTWSMDEAEILAGLRVILRAKGPVLVHCQHGADRTGTLLAAYRMVVQGWPRTEALAEMLDGGYGYHAVWGNLPTLLEGLDVEGLRAQLLAE